MGDCINSKLEDHVAKVNEWPIYMSIYFVLNVKCVEWFWLDLESFVNLIIASLEISSKTLIYDMGTIDTYLWVSSIWEIPKI